MLLFAASMGLAADPPPPVALLVDPVVGSRAARVELGAGASLGESARVSMGAGVEGDFSGRLAVRASALVPMADAEEVELTAAARVELAEAARAGVDLAAGLRYKRTGFREEAGEAELLLAAARTLGNTRLLANLTGGRGLSEPEWDVEGALGGLVSVGENLGVGGAARGRIGATAHETKGAAGEAEAEAERRGDPAWDVVVGPTVNVSVGAATLSVFGGGEANEGGAGARAEAGLRFLF